MPINPCNTSCVPYQFLRPKGTCEFKFRDQTIKYLIAVRCDNALATTVFANADGAAGDIAFLTLLNSALSFAAGQTRAYVFPVANYEFPEPETTERTSIACNLPVLKKHSQQPTFTVNNAIDIADTFDDLGLSQASEAIGWHTADSLYYLENQPLSIVEAQKHVYFAVTCEGFVFVLGRSAGETPLAMLASVMMGENTDNPRERYVESVITLRSSVWITNPKYWTPRAIINGVTNAGLTVLNQLIQIG